MSVWSRMVDKVREGMQSFLEIQPPIAMSYNVWGDLDFAGNAVRNRLWYRGQAVELEEFWKQVPGEANRRRFWAAVPNRGREIEKIHVGLPALIVDMLTDIVVTDLQQIDAGEGTAAEAWDEIAGENRFEHLLHEAVAQALIIGDGAFKVSLDPELSDLPIIEFVPGDRIDLKYRRGRLEKVRFKTKRKGCELWEEYSRGRIEAVCVKDGERRKPSEMGFDMPDLIEWDGGFMLAVPLRFFPSAMYEGRGGLVFDSRSENFDALDEAWSQWMDALRKARTKEYIPEALLPRDPETGAPMMPTPFDNAYIRVDGTMAEGASNKVEVVQPDIKHDSYFQTYANALDLCLMGLISPSTLGIDVKKLDNAEAQREKEKATLYTRNKMVSVLQATIPELVDVCVRAWQTSQGIPATGCDATAQFGEYATPSFESMVETVGKARVQGIMSIEAVVEELYGDTRSEEWKAEEVGRLKAEGGMPVEEPSTSWGEILAASGRG